jgi:hypothetical protein
LWGQVSDRANKGDSDRPAAVLQVSHWRRFKSGGMDMGVCMAVYKF